MKKIIKFIIIVPIIVAILIGVYYAFISFFSENFTEKKVQKNVFGIVQTRRAELTEYFIYGTSLNLTGKLDGIAKDNIETVKVVLTDGKGKEEVYKTEYKFVDNILTFTTSDEMNMAIDLEKLKEGKYYLLLRLKLNNSVNYRYYAFENKTTYGDLEYYTITRNNFNNKVSINFGESEYEGKKIPYINLVVAKSELPEDVYDIVIDASHGGRDKGETNGEYTEADISLKYALKLKTKLEELGFKIKLTRDGTNDDKITDTSMYDEDGRVNIAQESKAKLLISLHLNEGSGSGIEVYAPCKSNLSFAKTIADNVVNNVDGIDYSDNSLYRKENGVYVNNFSKTGIDAFVLGLEKQGIEPYNVNTDTPYLYIIREVGGIATNAYVDGRNSLYGKNKYCKSNIGIESYQIELGYMQTDIDSIIANEDAYIEQLANSIKQYKVME